MSRSGYNDDMPWSRLVLYRQAVDRAIAGRRGQAFMRRMLVALDTLPCKELAHGGLVTEDGVCAMGAVVLVEGLAASGVDPCERDEVAALFDIAPSMAAEIACMNDDGVACPETPSERFARMRRWIESNVRSDP